MIEWKGLYANTPYSSANNKTQDDAVVGMQDTIYVTGPGYGGYSANVRVHNASGDVVALIPVSGGGGSLSAPAPVRILDDSTTYSYSLEVVRGAIPSDDADKIVVRIVGGASKRYPGQGSTLSDGSTSFAGSMRVEGYMFDSQSRDVAGARVDLLDQEGAYATWTGTYTGTGTGTITTVLPFVPSLVIVKGATFGAQVWHRAARNTSSSNFNGAVADTDYLTVSGKSISCIGATQLNESGIVYKIFAICDPFETAFSARASAYSTQPMKIFPDGVSFAIIKRDNARPPFLAVGSSFRSFDNTIDVSGGSIAADGTVNLPDNDNVNTGENTSLLGFIGGRSLAVMTYNGDTSNPMPIYSPFDETECIMWFPIGASTQRASMFFPGLDASNLYSFQSQAVAALPAVWAGGNRITLPAGGGAFNRSGERYLCLIWKKQSITPVPNLGYATAPSGKTATLMLNSGAYLDCGFSDSLRFSNNGTFEWWGVYSNGTVNGASAGNNDAVTRCLFARANGDYGIPNAVSFGLFAGNPPYLGGVLPTYISVTGGSANFPTSGSTSGPTVPISYSLINVPQAQWDHFVVTVEGGTKWKYFRNGKLMKIYDNGTVDARLLVGRSGHRMVIGGLPGVGSAAPTQMAGNCGISVVRIYSRALSELEVAQNYRSAVSGKLYAPASDFVEEWDAKNYVTGTLPATKSPGNNGTLSGVARLLQYV